MPELMMNQDVGVEAPTTYDAYGKASYGSVTTYKGRVELGLRRRLDPRGDVVITDGFFGLPSTLSALTTKHRLTYNGVKYRPVFIDQIVGRSGALHHLEVEAEIWR